MLLAAAAGLVASGTDFTAIAGVAAAVVVAAVTLLGGGGLAAIWKGIGRTAIKERRRDLATDIVLGPEKPDEDKPGLAAEVQTIKKDVAEIKRAIFTNGKQKESKAVGDTAARTEDAVEALGGKLDQVIALLQQREGDDGG